MDVIYTWIRNIVIYMILNTIIMNLLGNSSYKKYVSIVSGMLLVLIVVSPLMNLMKLDDNFDYFLQANDLSVETSDFKNNLRNMEEKQSGAIFADYTDKIRKNVENLLLADGFYLNSFDVTFNKDATSASFGEILSMNITASLDKKGETAKSKISIDKINIDRIEINKVEKDAAKGLPSPAEINIKNELSDFYNIEPANINISIQGG
ncbi:MAG TPA: stage III sporulation protein AF [Mobilitalea sp.]|nr:stage III sporulation protein AF [Mobilitalea sp.]